LKPVFEQQGAQIRFSGLMDQQVPTYQFLHVFPAEFKNFYKSLILNTEWDVVHAEQAVR
jgi:hypothetical protein